MSAFVLTLQPKFRAGGLRSRIFLGVAFGLNKVGFFLTAANRETFKYLRRSNLTIAERFYDRLRSADEVARHKRRNRLMNEAGKQITRLVGRALYPRLKELGFCQNGKDFSKQVGEAWQFIRVQSIYWGDLISGRVILGAGTYFPSVAQLLYGADVMPTRPKEFLFLVRYRARVVLPGEEKHRWTVDPETDSEAIERELNRVLEDRVLPWLERVKTLAGAIPQIHGTFNWPLPAVAAKLALGERESASRLIKKSIEYWQSEFKTARPTSKPGIAGNIEKLNKWSEKHNLPGFWTLT